MDRKVRMKRIDMYVMVSWSDKGTSKGEVED